MSSLSPIVKCYYVFRKEKSCKAAKAYRDGQKEYDDAVIKELKTLN